MIRVNLMLILNAVDMAPPCYHSSYSNHYYYYAYMNEQ